MAEEWKAYVQKAAGRTWALAAVLFVCLAAAFFIVRNSQEIHANQEAACDEPPPPRFSAIFVLPADYLADPFLLSAKRQEAAQAAAAPSAAEKPARPRALTAGGKPRLVGTAAVDGKWAAIIACGQRETVCRAGEKAGAYTVVEIAGGRVKLRGESGCIVLEAGL